MKEFLLILFLGSRTLLTPDPIALQTEIEIHSTKVLDVVTRGAHLEIDLSEDAPSLSQNLEQRFKILEALYPPGTVTAKLFAGNREIAVIEYRGAMTSAPVLLLVSDALTTKMTFDRIHLETRTPFRRARITWVNYSE